MSAVPHYSVTFEEDRTGWHAGSCICGFETPAFHDVDLAVDCLMDHAYLEGVTVGIGLGKEQAATPSITPPDAA